MLSLKKLTLTGAMILVMLAAPLAVVQADIPGLVSDDFHDGFNTSLWQPDTLEEYDHESTFFSQQTAGGDSYLQIAVPGGAKRSLSFDAGSLQAPRVLQEVQDDGTKVFTFTARFLSIPSFPSDPETGDPVGTAIQGIVIKGVYDPSDIPGVQSFPSYWRLGVQSTTIANQVKPYGSWFYKSNQGWGPGFTVFEPPYQPDDEEDYRINAPQNTPLWLKVDRTVEQIDGNVCSTFTFSYSLDGDDWIESPPKDQDIPPENSCGGPPYFLNRIRDTFKITHIGIFAGTTGDNPAYTAKIDWVSITDTAPDNEDEDPPVSTYTESVFLPMVMR